MNEIVVIWVVTLVTWMADGTHNAAAQTFDTRRQCMSERSQVIERADDAKAKGIIKGYFIECMPAEMGGKE